MRQYGSAASNPVLGIVASLKNKVEKKEHEIPDYKMESMATEGCGAKLLKAIEDGNAYSAASAIMDLIELHMAKMEKKEEEAE
jgi:hypothetical protein